jgi:hypothetical protein
VEGESESESVVGINRERRGEGKGTERRGMRNRRNKWRKRRR